MNEERRLMQTGIPLEDAITLCASMRRERDTLERFIEKQEEVYRGKLSLLRK